MQQDIGRPEVSVVIPTYNRAPLLRRMLEQLTRQDVPLDSFEVIVSDDGSSDDTRDVVEAFAGRLRIGYHFQQDQGMRVGLARNEGARLATAPVLVFLDSGCMVGPDFVRQHLVAHADPAARRAVIGYAWGYNPMEDPVPGLAEALDQMPPEQVLARFKDQPAMRDVRHPALEAYDFELARMPLAWRAFFTNNCSVRTDEFWAVDGFDESYVLWGAEDLDLGLRLERNGLTPYVVRDAWIIEWPHERVMTERWQELIGNMGRFLAKYPEPAIELGCLVAERAEYWRWEQEWLDLLEWTRKSHDIDVAEEVAAALRRTGSGQRVAIIGCGAVLPSGAEQAHVADFDRELLDQATRGATVTGHHAIGIRTVLPDQSVDVVIVTSRLAGLWERWGDSVRAEAARIGRKVDVFADHPGALG
ncbi:glycosyltransferase [Dactylosporangium sp. NPDC051484]|uniref:glycosyltransferase n=1 Tax=Dactylosporangium sp. NPDC051484 TaxID=3154942 RepID=UPI00344EBCB1